MSVSPIAPSTSTAGEDPRIRRAELRITLALMVLSTAVVMVLGLHTDLTLLPRLAIIGASLVAAYPLLRMVLYPRAA